MISPRIVARLDPVLVCACKARVTRGGNGGDRRGSSILTGFVDVPVQYFQSVIAIELAVLDVD
jgi:hypothetical protein